MPKIKHSASSDLDCCRNRTINSLTIVQECVKNPPRGGDAELGGFLAISASGEKGIFKLKVAWQPAFFESCKMLSSAAAKCGWGGESIIY